MLRIPDRFQPDAVWLMNRFGNEYRGEFQGEVYALGMMLFTGREEEAQDRVFGACTGAPWLQGVPSGDRAAQLAALAGCFENAASPAPLAFAPRRYPLTVPKLLEPGIRALALELARSPEATLSALLAVAIAFSRSAFESCDIPASIARLAAQRAQRA